MESCANVFSDVKEESILEEIAQSEEGRNKLKGLSLHSTQIMCQQILHYYYTLFNYMYIMCTKHCFADNTITM